jgi:DNA replication protein DnaC
MARIKNRPPREPDPPTDPKIAFARQSLGLEVLDFGRERLQQKNAMIDLQSSLGKRYAYGLATLDKFEIYHKAQESAIAKVREFLADLPSAFREGRSLVLYGAVGTGKDHILAASLYQAAMLTIPTNWLSGQEFYGRIRDSMDTGEREESLMERWGQPFVLGVSDPIPPIGKPSEWNTSQLYRILDRRYRAMRCSWVSMNANSLEDADAKLSAPIFDRLRDGACLVPCFWPSYRERKKK